MSVEEIEHLAADLKECLNEAQVVLSERDFYVRVLKQLVLTHGELSVDTGLAEAATKDTRKLEFSAGSIKLI